MKKIFIQGDNINKECITIYGNDAVHIRDVLRMKAGETLIFCHDHTDYHCRIKSLSPKCVTAVIDWIQEEDLELPVSIHIYQGLPKSTKMDYIVQKCVELGAASITPVETIRSVVKLSDAKKKMRQVRWQEISKNAAEQSGRGIVPYIGWPLSYAEALEDAKKHDLILIPYENTKGMKETRSTISALKGGTSVAVFIGPEGGFDKSEIEKTISYGGKTISLGRRILRTETAAMALLAMIIYQIED